MSNNDTAVERPKLKWLPLEANPEVNGEYRALMLPLKAKLWFRTYTGVEQGRNAGVPREYGTVYT